MPKVVDHAERRDEIAFAACRAVAEWGFEGATMARIAKAAGCTTGMIAHYFETKQDIVLAALRLISRRMEDRLSARLAGGESDLAEILAEALPLDDQRQIETAVWIGFWGHVGTDETVQSINHIVHEEWTELIRRLVLTAWPELADRPKSESRDIVRSVHIFLNGLTASAATSPHDWPPEDQIRYLKQHLGRLRAAL
ncbi:MAG: TetR/AcrR family transcriptional regulator [Pseudomonadota bacterium]